MTDWVPIGSVTVGPQDPMVQVGHFVMDPDDDVIWIKITQNSPQTLWQYSYGLLTWRSSEGKELGTIKVYGDIDGETFKLGVGLPPLDRNGMFEFTARAYNRQWISIAEPPEWTLSFKAKSGKAVAGAPVFGTRATLGVLADLVDAGVSYSLNSAAAPGLATVKLTPKS